MTRMMMVAMIVAALCGTSACTTLQARDEISSVKVEVEPATASGRAWDWGGDLLGNVTDVLMPFIQVSPLPDLSLFVFDEHGVPTPGKPTDSGEAFCLDRAWCRFTAPVPPSGYYAYIAFDDDYLPPEFAGALIVVDDVRPDAARIDALEGHMKAWMTTRQMRGAPGGSLPVVGLGDCRDEPCATDEGGIARLQISTVQ